MGFDGTLCLIAASLVTFGGCGEPEPQPEPEPEVEILDPSQAHFGQDYTEWAGAWIEWWYETPLTDCEQLSSIDPTGEWCGLGNDDDDVFFLAGNSGGTTKRGACVVPAGKALFFPILFSPFDNGGVAEPLPDETVRANAEADIGNFVVSDLVLEVDGVAADGLGELGVVAAPYTYTLPPEPNIYTCLGAPGVLGTFPGYGTGYWALLPPLEPGTHRIRFAGTHKVGDAVFQLDVTFDPLTVE